jgi:hypothetical protein
MAYTNYKETTDKVATLTPFEGNNLKGVIVGGEYLIYSYSTLMATVELSTKQIWLNEEKYSQTTSRQMTFVKKGLEQL